jgi:PEP-CTERM/exosortase A-associated glycosyltransferase
MNVLHVLHTSLPDTSGYSIRSDSVLRCQRALGIVPTVVTSARHPNGEATEEEIDGTRYLRTSQPRGTAARFGRQTPFLREAELMAALGRRLAGAVREVRPSLIHAHSPVLCGLPALRVARRFGVPFVYEVRDLWENASVDKGKFAHGSARYRIARALETAVVRRADAVTTICDGLARELLSRGVRAERLVLVPNGVDVTPVDSCAAAEDLVAHLPSGWRSPDPILAYIGSFSHYEGLDLLVRAMPAIVACVPAARLLLVGDGEARPGLERRVRELGLGNHVRFTGRVPHAVSRACYAHSRICVYPRLWTSTTALTTPLKPLEAMAAGCAVLASDVPAMREIVRDGETGLLCRAGDPSDLAEHAVRLLHDPTLRATLGARGRAYVLAEREWSRVTAPYRELYERLVARGSGLRAQGSGLRAESREPRAASRSEAA